MKLARQELGKLAQINLEISQHSFASDIVLFSLWDMPIKKINDNNLL